VPPLTKSTGAAQFRGLFSRIGSEFLQFNPALPTQFLQPATKSSFTRAEYRFVAY